MEVSTCSFFSNSYEEPPPWVVGVSSVITTIAVAILTCGFYHLTFYPKIDPLPSLQGRAIPVDTPSTEEDESTPLLEELLEGTMLDKKPCVFRDFRNPNEYTVEKGIPPHLEGMRGWIISTGSERSLFDLLLAPSECEGLLVRDINWKIKAYLDCVVMLLRISQNLSEFSTLITRFDLEPGKEYLFRQKQLPAILEKLNQASLPPAIKKYYLENFDDLIQCYFYCAIPDFPTDPSVPNVFESIDYRKHPKLFEKLKHYANSGRIVTTVGRIEDLQEVSKAITIGVVDTSNIQDYGVMDIQTGEQNPRVLWVRDQCGKEKYFSLIHHPLSKEEQDEFTQLLQTFIEASPIPNSVSSTRLILRQAFCRLEKLTGRHFDDIFLCHSKKSLTLLKDYCKKYVYTIKNHSVDLLNSRSQKLFFDWVYSSKENLQNVINDPSFQPFIEVLKDKRIDRNADLLEIIDTFVNDFQRYQS